MKKAKKRLTKDQKQIVVLEERLEQSFDQTTRLQKIESKLLEENLKLKSESRDLDVEKRRTARKEHALLETVDLCKGLKFASETDNRFVLDALIARTSNVASAQITFIPDENEDETKG